MPTPIRHGRRLRPSGSRHLPDLGMEQPRGAQLLHVRIPDQRLLHRAARHFVDGTCTGTWLGDRIHPDTANRASARMACRLAWRQGIEPRVHHHHRVVDRCVLPTTGGAGAVVPVQPGRLARHCTSAHGIPFWALAIWVSYLIVATPMHRHKTLAEPNADAMDDNNETEEQH